MSNGFSIDGNSNVESSRWKGDTEINGRPVSVVPARRTNLRHGPSNGGKSTLAVPSQESLHLGQFIWTSFIICPAPTGRWVQKSSSSRYMRKQSRVPVGDRWELFEVLTSAFATRDGHDYLRRLHGSKLISVRAQNNL